MYISEKFEKDFDFFRDRNPLYELIFKIDFDPDNISVHEKSESEFFVRYKNFVGIKSIKNRLLGDVEEMILWLRKNKSLTKISNDYLSILLEDLEKTLTSFYSINYNGHSFHFQSNSRITTLMGGIEDIIKFEDIKDLYKYEILCFSESKYELISILITEIKDLIMEEKNLTSEKKIKTSLSVPALTLLFKLLYEEGVFDEDQKTNIFNFIADNFSTKRQVDISPGSIKNKFYDTDNKTIEELKSIILPIYQKLKGNN